MNKLRLLIVQALFGLSLLFCLIPASANAVNVLPICSQGAGNTSVCQSVNPGKAGENPIIKALKIVIGILAFIIGAAAVIVIIVAGLAMINAGGDAQAVAKARGSIIYALVGLIVAAIAGSLVAFVLNKL